MIALNLAPGDCRDTLDLFAMLGKQFDAVITDPPYHLTSVVDRFGKEGAAPAQEGTDGAFARASRGFMGKEWDGGDIAFRPDTWRRVLDVMKPGAFMVAFASTRGYHRMVCAIEDAGFVIHPMLGWLFGTGFPKATRFKGLPDLDGWRYGLQAMKPALEPICLAQKPLAGTGPQNWAKYGVGGLHIDACRVETDENLNGGAYSGGDKAKSDATSFYTGTSAGTYTQPSGRWPANILHDGSPEVLAAFAAFGESKSAGGSGAASQNFTSKNGIYGKFAPKKRANADGLGDTGTAARFFYCAKASKSDRANSKHPTVKPLSLMRWLCKLITPPGGVILDPFAGSGTTLQAAFECGFSATGCEADPEYQGDITRRIEALLHVNPVDQGATT